MNESSFKSVYRRHTPFSMVQYTTVIQGNTIIIEPRGDLLSYIYLTRVELSTGLLVPWDWNAITEFSWYIGGQLIDKQNINYIRYIFPNFVAKSQSKMQSDTLNTLFLPLAFSFCHDLPLPLVSMNYDKMDIRLTFGDSYDVTKYSYQCFINYIFLDEPERDWFASHSFEVPITQVQEIYDTKNVSMSGPVKFIATPPTKIPADFEYTLSVNGKPSRDKGPYSGSELMFHSDYATNYTLSSDKYPPAPIFDGSTFIDSAYGRGIYTASATTYTADNPPWNVTDGTDSYWQSGLEDARRLVYTASASSNNQNAFQAFGNANSFSTVWTAWVSDRAYGTLKRYEIAASSNVSNAWMALNKTWISDPESYGANTANIFTQTASSNIINSWMAFSDKSWVSDASFYSDYIGTYSASASSNVGNAINCFDSVATGNFWASNSSYGYLISKGQYSTFSSSNVGNSWIPFSATGGSWISNVNFGYFSAPTTIQLSQSSEDVLNIFKDPKQVWASNSYMNTYGFSSWYGLYNCFSTSNTTNAWKAYTPSTQWISDGVFGNTYTRSYSVNVTSSQNATDTPDWKQCDSNILTQWSGNVFYGPYQGDAFTVTHASSNTGNAWKSYTVQGNWISISQFGNVISGGPYTYTASASSNTANAWRSFGTSTWISDPTYIQPDVTPGVYANTISSGTMTGNIFGKTDGSWTGTAKYGVTIPSGTYVSNTNSGTSSNSLYEYTGSFTGITTVDNSSKTANCSNEYFTTIPAGVYTTNSSNNSPDSWKALTTTGLIFSNLQYKTSSTGLPTITTGFSVAAITTTYSTTAGPFTPSFGSARMYSNTPGGQYNATASAGSTGSPWTAFSASSTYNSGTRDGFSRIALNQQTAFVKLQLPYGVQLDSIPTYTSENKIAVSVSTDNTTYIPWAAGVSYQYYKFSPTDTIKDPNYNPVTPSYTALTTKSTADFQCESGTIFGGFSTSSTITSILSSADAWKAFSTVQVASSTWTPIGTPSQIVIRTSSTTTRSQYADLLFFSSPGINYNDSAVTFSKPSDVDEILLYDGSRYYTRDNPELTIGTSFNIFVFVYYRQPSITDTTTPERIDSSNFGDLLGNSRCSYSGPKLWNYPATGQNEISYLYTGSTQVTTFTIPNVCITGFSIRVYDGSVNATITQLQIAFDRMSGFNIDNPSFTTQYRTFLPSGQEIYTNDTGSINISIIIQQPNNGNYNVYISPIIKYNDAVTYNLVSLGGPVPGGQQFYYLSRLAKFIPKTVFSLSTDSGISKFIAVCKITNGSVRSSSYPLSIREQQPYIAGQRDIYFYQAEYTPGTPQSSVYTHIEYTFNFAIKEISHVSISLSGKFDGTTLLKNIIIQDLDDTINSPQIQPFGTFVPGGKIGLSSVSFTFDYALSRPLTNVRRISCKFELDVNGGTCFFSFVPSISTTPLLYLQSETVPRTSAQSNRDMYASSVNDGIDMIGIYDFLNYSNTPTTTNKISSKTPYYQTIIIYQPSTPINFTSFRLVSDVADHYVQYKMFGIDGTTVIYDTGASAVQVPLQGGTTGYTTFATPTSSTTYIIRFYSTTRVSFTDVTYKLELLDSSGNYGVTYTNNYYTKYLPPPKTVSSYPSDIVTYTPSSYRYFPRMTSSTTCESTGGGYKLTPSTTPSITLTFQSSLGFNDLGLNYIDLITTPQCTYVIRYYNGTNNDKTSAPITSGTGKQTLDTTRAGSLQLTLKIEIQSVLTQPNDNKITVNSLRFYDSSQNLLNDSSSWKFNQNSWNISGIRMSMGGTNILSGVFTSTNTPTITYSTSGITKNGGNALSKINSSDNDVGEWMSFNFAPVVNLTDVVVSSTSTITKSVYYRTTATYNWASIGDGVEIKGIQSIYIYITSCSTSTLSISDVIFYVNGSDGRVSASTYGGPYTGKQITSIDPTAGVTGEWFDYRIPYNGTVNSVTITSSEIRQYDVLSFTYGSTNKFKRMTAITQSLPTNSTAICTQNQTSNLFRIIVRNTYVTTIPVAGGSVSAGLVGLIASFSMAGGVLLPQQTSNSTVVFSSGLDVGFLLGTTPSFSTVPGFVLKNANNLVDDNSFRNVLSPPLGRTIMISGNIYPTFSSSASGAKFVIDYPNSGWSSLWVALNRAVTSATGDTVAVPGSTADFLYIPFAFGVGDFISFKAIITKGTGSLNLRLSKNDLPVELPLKFAIYAGGPYMGYGSNLYTQIELPTNVKLGGYILDPGTANTWVLYGISAGVKTRLDSNTTRFTRTDYALPSTVSSYSTYRLEITSTTSGNLYGRIDSFILKDTNLRTVTPTLLGTNLPVQRIPNFQLGQYTFDPPGARQVLYRYYGGQYKPDFPTITLQLPSSTTLKYIYATGDFASFTVTGVAGIFYQGFSPLTTPTTLSTITINFSGFNYVTYMIFYNSTGRIFPIEIPDDNFVTPRYYTYPVDLAGISTVNSITTTPGDYVTLSIPTANVYKYSINPAPLSWDLVGKVGSTWTTIESIRDCTSATYSSILVNKSSDVAYSNVGIVIFESLEYQQTQSNATLQNVNFYARNFTNAYSVQTVTKSSSSSLYIGVSPLTRDVSDKRQTFDVTRTFNNPSRITKITFQNAIKQGIQTNVGADTTFSTTLGSGSGPFTQYGNLYAYNSGTYTFRITAQLPNRSSVTIDGSPYFVTTSAGWNANYGFNWAAGSWHTISIVGTAAFFIGVTLPNGQTDLTNSLFPNQSPTPKFTYATAPSAYSLSGRKSGSTTATTIQSGPVIPEDINVISVSDTSFFDSITLTLTKSVNSNITSFTDYRIYNEYGPINVQNASGGTSSEWVQLNVPTVAALANSYSFVSNASSWVLESAYDAAFTTIKTVLHTVKSYYKSEKYFFIPPPPQPSFGNKYYRLTVTENNDSNLSIGYFKLFDSNQRYINPYQTSNTYSDTSTYRPGGMIGKYEFASSTTADYSTIFDGVTRDTAFAGYDSTGYTGTSSTKIDDTTLVYGNWAQIKLPLGSVANTFVMTTPSTPLNSPNTFTFCGSYDGYNWATCNTVANYFTTLPTPCTQYSFNSLQLSNNYNYYRFIVSNCITTNLKVGTIKMLDKNGLMINSFVSSVKPRLDDPTVFGGGNTAVESLTLNLTATYTLSSFSLAATSYGEYPSNISVYDSITGSLIENLLPSPYDGNTVSYNFSNPSALSNVKFAYNSINYNPSGRPQAYIANLQLYSSSTTALNILPTFTSNITATTRSALQTLNIQKPYLCSNILPFDDDSNTSWYADTYKASDGTSLTSPAPGISFIFPYSVNLYGVHLKNSTLKDIAISNTTVTQTVTPAILNNVYYVNFQTPLRGNTFYCNVTSTLPGMNTCSIGGLTFYGNTAVYAKISRLNPTMTSLSTIINLNSIIAGGPLSGDLSSNENVTIRFYGNLWMNSYSICTNPLPSSWNVYTSDSTVALHSVTNFYDDSSPVLNYRFPTSNVSNLRIEVYSTQPQFSSSGPSNFLNVKHLQLYSNTGEPLIPTMTSNTTYIAGKYSSEVPGMYIVSASYVGNDVTNAFNGDLSTSYSSPSLPSASSPSTGSTGFTLLYSNIVVSNCTDFRDFSQATKGLVPPNASCRWIGYLPSLTTYTIDGRTTTVDSTISINYNGGGPFPSYAFNGSNILSTYTTGTSTGDWIQIQFPTFVYTNGVLITSSTPQTMDLLGSFDGVTWVSIVSVPAMNVLTNYTITLFYKYFRLVSSTQFTNIQDVAFYNIYGRINSYLV